MSARSPERRPAAAAPMRQNAPNIALFAVLAAALVGGWWYVEKTFFPPPPWVPPPPPREALLALTGVAPTTTPPADGWKLRTRPEEPKPADEPRPAAAPVAAPAPPSDPPTFVVLGGDDLKESFKRVVLTTRGAAVQQVVLNTFDEADRLGREVRLTDGRPQRMHIIPGVNRPRSAASLTALHDNPALAVVPDLPAGVAADAELRATLAEPSYVILHYPAKDDPARQPDDARTMNDGYPSPELGDRHWTLVSAGRGADGGPWSAVFETDLGAPYFLKLRKTYTLGPKDYHVGLRFEVVPLPGRAKGKGVFRYQLAGAHGLPVEGEWYTSIFRNVMAGWTTPNGAVRRSFDDAASIHLKGGGDKVVRADNVFDYAAVATQYFASAAVVDDDQPAAVRKSVWDYVRATREPAPGDDPTQLYLSDVTVRAVASPLDPGPADTITHGYLLYNGPVKVGLLRQMSGDKEVSADLVTRYADVLNLRTMTDYHSPHFFGRLANMIWWSDVVIFFTNLMHSVLGFLHNNVVSVWGLDIILLTVMVRLMLFGPSRRQQAAMAKMQARMTQLKPEIDKLHEKYKDDYHAFNQAKTRLLLEHGVNPLSTMGGCALLFAQMPVLMGLYFCLQESVFFRLEPFLWVPNLAAPDMLAWWSERVPFVSTPDNMYGATYLGPYLNILPIVSVVLIFIHQMKTLPPPTDEQQEMQQRMMKIMVGMMAIFFYKVPAGLCIYFICGTLWALMERQFIPKPDAGPLAPLPEKPADAGRPGARPPAAPATPPGGFMGKLRAKMEEMQRQAEEQSKRQIRNAPPPDDGPDRKGRDKKRKRK